MERGGKLKVVKWWSDGQNYVADRDNKREVDGENVVEG